jgi:hypothetical protein
MKILGHLVKILGQNEEFSLDGSPYSTSKRQIEIDESERISIRVKNKVTGIEEDVMSFFMSGVLTLEWEKGAKLPAANETSPEE